MKPILFTTIFYCFILPGPGAYDSFAGDAIDLTGGPGQAKNLIDVPPPVEQDSAKCRAAKAYLQDHGITPPRNCREAIHRAKELAAEIQAWMDSTMTLRRGEDTKMNTPPTQQHVSFQKPAPRSKTGHSEMFGEILPPQPVTVTPVQDIDRLHDELSQHDATNGRVDTFQSSASEIDDPIPTPANVGNESIGGPVTEAVGVLSEAYGEKDGPDDRSIICANLTIGGTLGFATKDNYLPGVTGGDTASFCLDRGSGDLFFVNTLHKPDPAGDALGIDLQPPIAFSFINRLPMEGESKKESLTLGPISADFDDQGTSFGLGAASVSRSNTGNWNSFVMSKSFSWPSFGVSISDTIDSTTVTRLGNIYSPSAYDDLVPSHSVGFKNAGPSRQR